MEIPEVKSASCIPINESAFEELFKSHFKKLFAYALTIVRNEMAAEEIVQNVFYKIWEKHGLVEIQTSVSAYLYRSVYNDSLNYLKHEKVKASYQAHIATRSKDVVDNAASKAQLSELQEKLNSALSELPEQCRTIFQMSRFEELKYHEIAERMGLSVKTIESQMGKALRILRIKLADYLPLLIILLIETIKHKTP
jgi:RNA polymerase sigma-70 factor (ECF subfamily)